LANADLDFLKQRKITHLILIGLIANTRIETMGRFPSEIGYHVTLVRDATAAASETALQTAHEINGPMFAHAIVPTTISASYK
jgi:nicotinamidase-related amidase